MSLGGGIEPTLHLPVPEIQLLGVTQEEWDGEEELQDEEGEGDEEEEGEGRNKVRLVRSHAIRDSVSPPPPERREEIAANMRGETSDQRSVVSSDGGEVGALEGGVVSGEISGANQPIKSILCTFQVQTVGGEILIHLKVCQHLMINSIPLFL